MKKKLLISTLIGTAVAMTGCGKEGDFKKAINAKLSTSGYECLYVSRPSIYSEYGQNTDEFKKLEDKTKDSYVVTERYRDGKLDRLSNIEKQAQQSLDTLANAGLLAKSTESLTTTDYNKKPNGYNTYYIYTLTDAGKATAAKIEPNGLSKSLFGDSGNRIFCFAHKEVDKIDNFTEGDSSGYHFAEVKYTYKYVDIADWISKPGIKEAFPEIDEKLNNPDKTSHVNLVKTNNGWGTDL